MCGSSGADTGGGKYDYESEVSMTLCTMMESLEEHCRVQGMLLCMHMG